VKTNTRIYTARTTTNVFNLFSKINKVKIILINNYFYNNKEKNKKAFMKKNKNALNKKLINIFKIKKI
jgi:hypothetical protein